MILIGEQRADGPQLAADLMSASGNQIVEVAEIRGARAADLRGTFTEWYEQSLATKCKQHLYSLLISPDPAQARLSRDQYFDLVARVERRLKLAGQPRVVVFHDRPGEAGVRRHYGYVVWSRIDTENRKALPIAHDRLKLQTVAREFCRHYGIALPGGMQPKKSGGRNEAEEHVEGEPPAQNQNARVSKEQRRADLADCWIRTETGPAFMEELEARGYRLARGTKRPFVVVDPAGRVHSLSRQLSGVANPEQLNERLSSLPLDTLPDPS